MFQFSIEAVVPESNHSYIRIFDIKETGTDFLQPTDKTVNNQLGKINNAAAVITPGIPYELSQQNKE